MRERRLDRYGAADVPELLSNAYFLPLALASARKCSKTRSDGTSTTFSRAKRRLSSYGVEFLQALCPRLGIAWEDALP
jgi:hypothetical protein